MPDIAVRPDELAATAQRLQHVGERLSGITRQLSRSSTSDVGARGLADALDDFNDHWKHGLGQLGEAADVTGAQLAEAARAYDVVDGAIAAACP
jgi:hypothetical protein